MNLYNDIPEQMKGKTLMITGGTGSFGSTVLNRFLTSDIEEIRIFSRDEKKQDDFRLIFRLYFRNMQIKFSFILVMYGIFNLNVMQFMVWILFFTQQLLSRFHLVQIPLKQHADSDRTACCSASSGTE